MPSQGLFIWIGIAAFAFIANLMICGGELADQSGTFMDDVLSIIGFSACDGIPEWVNFAIGLFIIIPGLMILGQLFAPVIGGLMANPVVGTIATALIAAAVIAGLVGILTAFFGT